MDFGVHIYNFTIPGEPDSLAATLAGTAQAADAGGAEWITLMDHWFQMESVGVSEDPMLEGYTSLGYLAGLTERAKLGLLVTGVTYRHPALLAKIVTTLDVLSGGRAFLGLGAAWYEREHLGLGVPYPPMGERFERLEETLRICQQMWSDDDGRFDGEHYQLAETICRPRPVQGHVPIVLGGQGERKTLRMVAQYADATNLFPIGAEGIRGKLDVLRGHCDALGRDYDTIRKTMLAPGDAVRDPDGFVAEMEAYAAAGIELVALMPHGPDPVGWVSTFVDEVAPRIAGL